MADGEKPSLGLSGQLPKDLSWYEIKPETAVGEKARKLLVDWSKIPPDQVDAHVEKIVSLVVSLRAAGSRLTDR